MKKIAILVAILITGINAWAQKDVKLLSIGEKEYGVNEFMYHYSKNSKFVESKESPQLYLERFIDYKLKLNEALRLKYDTSKSFRDEYARYKSNLMATQTPNTLIMDSLCKVAYDRKNEIREIYFITIAIPEGSTDTARYYTLADSIRKAALKGDDFSALAKKYSSDKNKRGLPGFLGRISAFDLPLFIENEVYSLKKDGVTKAIRSPKGLHIFKVTKIMPNPGEVRVAHIVRFFPNDSTKRQATRDSMELILKELKNGADFLKMAILYSADETVKDTKAELPWFSVNQVLPEIEENAFALRSVGDLSPVFATRLGYHIVKMLEKRGQKSFEESKAEIAQQIDAQGRFAEGYSSFFEQKKKEWKFKEVSGIEELKPLISAEEPAKAFADAASSKKYDKVIFSIKNKNFTQNSFAESISLKLKAGKISLPEQFLKDEYGIYLDQCLQDTYQDEVLERDMNLRMLLQEYYDGLLIFDLMEHEIWDKAKTDSVGLANFFEANKKKYESSPKVEVSMVKVQKIETMQAIKKLANEHPDWGLEQLLAGFQSPTDSLKVAYRKLFEKGEKLFVSTIINAYENGEKNSVDFDAGERELFFVHEFIPAQLQELAQVKGFVMADYQDRLEKEWLKSLRARFKPEVNKKAVKKLPGYVPEK